jgi:hypothetical protein
MKSIKYEDLMRGRVDLKKLGEFLSLLDFLEANAAQGKGLVDFEQVREGQFFSELWGKEFSDSRIGRHKDELDSGQISEVGEITGRLRELFGYA